MGEIFGLVIVRPLGLILLGIFKTVGSYGLAVILFALLVKLICIPLAIKGKKSMLAMNALNAEMQQLQKKYANNRVKLNEEMQKLYDKHGVNPMSGCLPQFIPLPIMMGLYYAVQQPLKFMMGFDQTVIDKLAVLVNVDTAKAGFYGQITIAEKLGQMFTDNGGVWPEAVTNITNGAGELLNIDFHFLGLNLAQTPSITHPSILWIIPILSGATAFLSSFVMQRMQGTQNSAAASQMKMMNVIMPLMSLYFGFILPGTIGIYWIFNNIFACVQEIVLTTYLRGKKEKKDAEEFARVEAEKEAKRAAHKAAQLEQSQNAKKKKGDK
ncbi:YidC/Oxa1 family membrane protein insertase [Agathobaculum sp. Marseille-P7918]|uniref:YidC/Oxa1 family membrane protein insertase n=1 Tax=Agathobaculum sp. Marseille-P7918 TaxID=2479843 RepID=UPI003569B4E8